VRWLAFVAKTEFVVPPVEKFKGPCGVWNFVAEVVGPTAVGVDIVKMLVKFLRQQPRNDVEIFVMMRGEPFGELLGSLRRTPAGGAFFAISSSPGRSIRKNSVVCEKNQVASDENCAQKKTPASEGGRHNAVRV